MGTQVSILSTPKSQESITSRTAGRQHDMRSMSAFTHHELCEHDQVDQAKHPGGARDTHLAATVFVGRWWILSLPQGLQSTGMLMKMEVGLSWRGELPPTTCWASPRQPGFVQDPAQHHSGTIPRPINYSKLKSTACYRIALLRDRVVSPTQLFTQAIVRLTSQSTSSHAALLRGRVPGRPVPRDGANETAVERHVCMQLCLWCMSCSTLRMLARHHLLHMSASACSPHQRCLWWHSRQH